MDCKLAFTRTKTGFHGDCKGSACAWGSGITDKESVIRQWETRHNVTFIPSKHLASAIYESAVQMQDAVNASE